MNHSEQTHLCYAALMEPTGQAYMDLTSKFVVLSSSSNNYILIVYNYDSNGILAVPLKNWHSESILAAYQSANAQLCTVGLCPKLQWLDNKASCALQDFMVAEDVDFQLVPPHVHCHNAVKFAICTFKNHFIFGLCSMDKHFPIHLWDCLLPQVELTLNLLHGSNLNPQLSTWVQMHDPFDFNCTSIAPPSTCITIHKKPRVHCSWVPHGIDDWYLGLALNSYWCYTVWATDTQAQCIADTITWLPSKIQCQLLCPQTTSRLALWTSLMPFNPPHLTHHLHHCVTAKSRHFGI